MAKIVARTSKSDRFRGMFAEGKTIAEVVAATRDGYAFVYGVAKRTPDPEHPGKSYAETRANRRTESPVSVTDDYVEVRIASGTRVRVNRETGTITRIKPAAKS